MECCTALSTISAIICSNFCAFLIFLVGRRVEAKARWSETKCEKRDEFFRCAVWGKGNEKNDEISWWWKSFPLSSWRIFMKFSLDRRFSEKFSFSILLRTHSNFKSCLFSPQSTSQRRKEKSPRLAARYLLSLMALAWFTSKDYRHFRSDAGSTHPILSLSSHTMI